MAYVSTSVQRRIIAKPVALALAFTFLLSPLTPVLAEETESPTPVENAAPAQSDTSTESSPLPAEVVEPEIAVEDTPVEETPPEEPLQPEDAEVLDIAEEDVTPWNRTSQSKPDAKMDEKSGALVYTYPISLPPARESAIDLPLTLTYNSQNQALSPFGYSWELSIPSIERVNKTGTDRLYDEQYFSSSISGELVLESGNTFFARSDEGERLVYTRTGDGWTVTDKKGTTYFFGDTSASRQDDPTDDSRIFKWMLSKVTSANGNTVVLTYMKDQGQIYPDTVTYNGTATRPGNLSVTFVHGYDLESVAEERVSPTMYATGFPVRTRYLINAIEVRHLGNVARTYALTYRDGDADWKPMLASIEESGRAEIGGEVTTLPPTVFEYKKFPEYEWTKTEGGLWDAPYPFYTRVGRNRFTNLQIGDVNGDTYPDFYRCENENGYVYLNDTKGGWTVASVDPVWTQEVCRYLEQTYKGTQALMFVDYNGDQLLDHLYSVSGEYQNNGGDISSHDGRIYTNTLAMSPLGSRRVWEWNPSYTVPNVGFAQQDDDITKPMATRVADVNADGFPDFLFGVYSYEKQANDMHVFLGDGTGWHEAPTGMWVLPSLIVEEHERDIAALEDINGDNLPDILYASANAESFPHPVDKGAVYLNTGTGWVEVTSGLGNEFYELQLGIARNDYVKRDYGSRFADFNGDGLTDQAMSQDWNGIHLRVRTGNTMRDQSIPDLAWLTKNIDPNPAIPFASNNGHSENGRLLDINSDGVQDFLESWDNEPEGVPTPVRRTYLGKGPGYSDVLETITLPDGGVIKATYTPTSQYRNSAGDLLNPKLPIRVLTVSSISRDDGRGNVGTDTYSYQGGHYYYKNPMDRRFAGFAVIETKDAIGNVTRTFYHQGNSTNQGKGEVADHESKIGKPYRIEEYNASGKLFRTTTNAWVRVPRGKASFVKLAKSLVADYDGLSTSAASAVEYTYDDPSGNLIEKRELGRVTASVNGTYSDVAGDTRTTSYEYAKRGTLSTSFISREALTGNSGEKVRETITLYDELPQGEVAKGNPTELREWIAGANYRSTTRAFNGFGLPTSSTDARGNTTTYQYDSLTLYPTLITTPLGLTNRYQYDYSSGQAIVRTDENGQVYRDFFDGADRLIEERIPNPANGSLVARTKYEYDDLGIPRGTTRTDFITPGISRISVTYRDGFGRTIQERKETEAGYAVKDTVYDSSGRIQKESAPYAGSGASFTSPTTQGSLYTSYTYDALDRPVTVASPTGSITKSYANWVITTTDQNGKKRIHSQDAYGNLAQVGEVNGPSTYLTNYSWSADGNLISLMDALGNVRTFTYDGLGNRTEATDLHAPSDSTYGIWKFVYDLSGNLTKTTDPRAIATTIAYDALNRPVSEDASNAPGVETAYTYDSCAKGKSKLCSATVTGGAETTYAYDALGGVLNETKRISGTSYTTSYTRDFLGTPLITTYPDSSTVTNGYNAATLLERVTQKESNGAQTVIVSNFDYAPTDAVVKAVYGDGTTLTNTYDATKGYRLSSKSLQKGSQKLQDVSYTYDKVGNITRLVDASATATKKTVDYQYDDLYRLTKATATAVAASTTPYTLSYSYNAIGNLTNKEGVAVAYQGTSGGNYANPHAPTKVGTLSLGYDRNGNLLSYASTTNAWDYKNRLTKTTLASGSVVENQYDHTGERSLQTVAGVATSYPNDLYSVSGAEKTRQVYGNGMLLASLETGGPTSVTSFMHGDHLGSTQVVTDKTGAVVQTLDYLPYGTTRVDTAPDLADREYIGELYDETTGLSYLNARYYDSVRGQFLSQDPVFLSTKQNLENPQRLNSYAYANGNPISNKDIDGKSAKTAAEGFVSPLTYAYENPGQTAVVVIAGAGLVVAAPAIAAVATVALGSYAVGSAAYAAYNAPDADTRDYYAGQAVSSAILTLAGTKGSQNLSAGKNWGNQSTLMDHTVRHGPDFGILTPKGYANYANTFKSKIGQEGIDSFTDANGVLRVYESKTNTFASYNKNGTTRTMYKPTNSKYWSVQKRKYDRN